MTSMEVRYRGAAQSVVSEILRIKQENGGTLTERLIVDAASDPASPLHNEFLWDNETAADGFRIIQARLLINRVKVQITQGETVRVMPAFVSVVDGEGRRVRVGSQEALSDPAMLSQVLADTKIQIRGLRNRLSAFDEAAAVVTQLDAVLQNLPAEPAA